MAGTEPCWDGKQPLGTQDCKAPDEPGIYAVYWADDKGNPLPVERALQPDAAGILYIGSAGNLREHLRTYLSPDGSQAPDSPCFPTNYRLYEAHRKWHPYAKLWIRWARTSNFEEDECWLGEAYMFEFLSLPPLNCKQPGKTPPGYQSCRRLVPLWAFELITDAS